MVFHVSSTQLDSVTFICSKLPIVVFKPVYSALIRISGQTQVVSLVQHETWSPEWDVWYDWVQGLLHVV